MRYVGTFCITFIISLQSKTVLKKIKVFFFKDDDRCVKVIERLEDRVE